MLRIESVLIFSERLNFKLVLHFRTVTLGVLYIIKIEIIGYGEREYGRTEVRRTANVYGIWCTLQTFINNIG